ncbi:hypothetical protein B0H65DRAFT_285490 [Neurospora tetraspora]|uniref:Secreted protein n=1 Tax=Neurospora tetraspora TaxID=94610 RepID=A0AAE0MPP5_9PEZI|nr:hypothetical protein B0H65DRAFT_285490 [Neurospora tetraspora]
MGAHLTNNLLFLPSACLRTACALHPWNPACFDWERSSHQTHEMRSRVCQTASVCSFVHPPFVRCSPHFQTLVGGWNIHEGIALKISSGRQGVTAWLAPYSSHHGTSD